MTHLDMATLDRSNTRDRRCGLALLYLAVLVVFFVLYALTVQRGPAWQDSGLFQWRSWTLDPRGRLGLALAHPLVIVLGNALARLPLGDVAMRINLLSALSGAFAAANVALLVRRLAPRAPIAAWFAAAGFGLAHSTWWLATIAQDQAPFVALFTLELNLLVWLIESPALYKAALLGLAGGLAWSVHNLELLALPASGLTVICLCVRRRLAWAAVAAMVLAWLVGGGLMLALVIDQAGHVGWAEAIRSALFGNRWQGAVLGASAKPVVNGLGYVAYNFPNLMLPMAAAGLWFLHKRAQGWLRWMLYYLAAAYFVFAIRYNIHDQFMFFLPFYAMTAVLAGIGLAGLTQGRRRWLAWAAVLSLAVGPAVYAAAPRLCKAAGFSLAGRDDVPYRDWPRYWLTPWKMDETSAADFAHEAMTNLTSGDTVIADGTTLAPLRWAQQVQGLSPGVRLLHNDQATPDVVPPGTPRVFVVSPRAAYQPPWMQGLAVFVKSSDNRVLYQVQWRNREAP